MEKHLTIEWTFTVCETVNRNYIYGFQDPLSSINKPRSKFVWFIEEHLEKMRERKRERKKNLDKKIEQNKAWL